MHSVILTLFYFLLCVFLISPFKTPPAVTKLPLSVFCTVPTSKKLLHFPSVNVHHCPAHPHCTVSESRSLSQMHCRSILPEKFHSVRNNLHFCCLANRIGTFLRLLTCMRCLSEHFHLENCTALSLQCDISIHQTRLAVKCCCAVRCLPLKYPSALSVRK